MRLLTGNGIHTPLILIAGFILGSQAGTLAMKWTQASPEALMRLPPLFGAWSALTGLVVFAFTAGRSRKVSSVDPATGKAVVTKTSHLFLCLTPAAWTFLMLVFGIPFIWMRSKGELPHGALIQSGPGFESFKAANTAINVASDGIAHGNTPQAMELARQFSARLGEFRNATIQKGGSMLSTTRGKMLTYCFLAPPRCVFLVHVPELRNFTDDAKEALALGAWDSAMTVTEKQADSLRQVVVGLRGAFFYERMIAGKHGVSAGGAPARLGDIRGDEATKAYLISLFDAAMKEPPPVVEAAPPSPQPPASVAEPALAARIEPPALPQPAAMPVAEMEKEPDGMRDWKDKDGRPLRARFLRFLPGSKTEVELMREDGNRFVIPVERFSTEDQQHIKNLAQPPVRTIDASSSGDRANKNL